MTVLKGFDQALRTPSRLEIVALLYEIDEARYSTIRDILGMNNRVLSGHLAALRRSRYVQLRKAMEDSYLRTWVSLTGPGRTAFQQHMTALHGLAEWARASLPKPSIPAAPACAQQTTAM